MRAMIMAAGLGTRLRPITYEMPKPMVPVLNRPVMEHILELLARHGFTEVNANLHWFPELIRDRFGDGSRLGIELRYSEEEALLGTAGGVRGVADFLGDDFLVISGDALTDIDLAAMRDFHRSHGGIATLATKRVADTSQFGVVITGADGRVQGFQEKPDPAEALSDLANCGVYMFRHEIFDFFPAEGESKAAGPDDPPGFADWAMDVLPALLDGDVPFYSHNVQAYWNDIGNLEELWRSNMDAVTGAVKIDPGAPEVAEGVRAGEGTDLAGTEVEPPALFGPGVEFGSDVRVDGPAVIGDGARIGAGARIKESVLLPGAEVGPATLLAGAIVAKRSA
jgi:mannose-1-phosphate guanylyltransferase/mannose-1-phosphate guanylyltransferase/phosphomannomutase